MLSEMTKASTSTLLLLMLRKYSLNLKVYIHTIVLQDTQFVHNCGKAKLFTTHFSPPPPPSASRAAGKTKGQYKLKDAKHKAFTGAQQYMHPSRRTAASHTTSRDPATPLTP